MYQPVNDSMEIVLEFNREGIIVFGNKTAEKELGYGDSLCGIKVYSIFVKEDSERNVFDEVKDTIEELEMNAYRRNATCFPVRVRIVPNHEKDGNTFLWAINVTTVKAMEKELLFLQESTEEARKIRNEFVANITHELRTPVNGIKGHIATLLSDDLQREQRKTLEIISRCCVDMSLIINNILDFSKLEAGKFSLENKEFNFYQMMDYVISTHIAIVNEKGLRIFLNITDHIPETLMGDELRLTQILNNLISNAVKFTDIGYVSVDVARSARYGDEIELFFLVRDSGIGISPEDKDRLFQSFSQVDTSLTRRYSGTGLGLVIAKELVALMGGNIHLDSHVGQGSNFSFSVKLSVAETDSKKNTYGYVQKFLDKDNKILNFDKIEIYYQFGTAENKREIKVKMEKLILALELEVWEKAEMLAANLKRLTAGGGEELKKTLLRLEMAVRSEDIDKSLKYYDLLKAMLTDGS